MQTNRNNFSLILFLLYDPYFTEDILIKEGMKFQAPYYGNRNIILRILREIHFRLNLPKKDMWFRPISDKYETFFIFADLMIPEYIEWLHFKNPDSNLIMCYMNNVNKITNPQKFQFDYLKLWSGDVNDCKKFGMKLMENSGAYSKTWIVKKETPLYDIFFVGKDKGMKRLPELLSLKKQFEDIGLKTYFHIVAEHRYDRYRNRYYKKFMPYEECLQYLGKTKAILYLGYGSQEAATIRVQESLIHKIKLVTDCCWIKKFDFYNSNNIFILGEDDLSQLKIFLNTPYVEVKAEILNHIYMEDLIQEIISKS